MAPLPPSNTPRFRIHYDQQGLAHTLQVRSHESPAALGTMMGNFLSLLGPRYMTMTVSSVDFAPVGSDIFNPVVTGLEGVSFGVATFLEAGKAYSIGFVGRTAGGRRVRIFVFGAVTLAANYRFSPGEDANVDNARAALVAASGSIRGIDDLTPVWKAYANVKPNDHWVGELR